MKNRCCVYPGEQAWSFPGLDLFCIFPVSSRTADLTLTIARILGHTSYLVSDTSKLQTSGGQLGLKPYGSGVFLVFCFGCQ